jgi:hypothetical protein
MQGQIDELAPAVQQQQKELDEYLAGLTVG